MTAMLLLALGCGRPEPLAPPPAATPKYSYDLYPLFLSAPEGLRRVLETAVVFD